MRKIESRDLKLLGIYLYHGQYLFKTDYCKFDLAICKFKNSLNTVFQN